jgi:hypothetical protein
MTDSLFLLISRLCTSSARLPFLAEQGLTKW